MKPKDSITFPVIRIATERHRLPLREQLWIMSWKETAKLATADRVGSVSPAVLHLAKTKIKVIAAPSDKKKSLVLLQATAVLIALSAHTDLS